MQQVIGGDQFTAVHSGQGGEPVPEYHDKQRRSAQRVGVEVSLVSVGLAQSGCLVSGMSRV